MALAVDTAAALIVALCIVGTAASFAAQRWRPAVSSALLLALGLCFQRAPLIWSQQTQVQALAALDVRVRRRAWGPLSRDLRGACQHACALRRRRACATAHWPLR